MWKKYSKWIDIQMYDSAGYYKLIQMKINSKNGKKKFRVVKIGFINDYIQKPKIYEKVLTTNIEDHVEKK